MPPRERGPGQGQHHGRRSEGARAVRPGDLEQHVPGAHHVRGRRLRGHGGAARPPDAGQSEYQRRADRLPATGGPAVRFRVRYNQREAFQPSTFTYANLGPKWTFDWLSYITDKPSSPSADVATTHGRRHPQLHGLRPRTQAFLHQQVEQTRLRRTSASSYEMVTRDGTRKDSPTRTARRDLTQDLPHPARRSVGQRGLADLRRRTAAGNHHRRDR